MMVELLPDGPSSIQLIGVIPESLDQFGLSASVRAAVPIVVARVLSELAALGVVPTPRENAPATNAFWDAA